MASLHKTMYWFQGLDGIYQRGPRSLLFGRGDGGLRYRTVDGRVVEGSQVISADTLGRAFKRGRFLRRAQRMFLRKKRRKHLTAMLLCLPHRLGQNTWLRIRQFTQRCTASFLQQVGHKHLKQFVSVVSLFVDNTKMKHYIYEGLNCWTGCANKEGYYSRMLANPTWQA